MLRRTASGSSARSRTSARACRGPHRRPAGRVTTTRRASPAWPATASGGVHRDRRAGAARTDAGRPAAAAGRRRLPAVRASPRPSPLARRPRAFVAAYQGRRRRRGQGLSTRRAHRLGADRAGRGVVRRPRPEDRRPRGRPRAGPDVDRLAPASRRTCGRRPNREPRAQRRRTPTSCSPTSRARGPRSPKAETFTADQMANGAKELLDEVATGKVTGEEERYRTPTSWDFQANVDGARRSRSRRARRSSPTGTRRSSRSSTPRFAAAAGRRSTGTGRRRLRRATPSSAEPSVKQLADAVNALAEPLSARITAAVAP